MALTPGPALDRQELLLPISRGPPVDIKLRAGAHEGAIAVARDHKASRPSFCSAGCNYDHQPRAGDHNYTQHCRRRVWFRDYSSVTQLRRTAVSAQLQRSTLVTSAEELASIRRNTVHGAGAQALAQNHPPAHLIFFTIQLKPT